MSLVAIFLIHTQRGPPHFRGPPPPPLHRLPLFHEHASPTSPAEKELWEQRKDTIREAFQHAYSGYEQSAFGFDELLPLSNGTRNK